LQDNENLGDNVDYSDRFVTDREFASIDELHNWADEIALQIGFQFVRASYKHKEGRTRKSLYLRCHRYGKYRGDLNLDNAVRPGTTCSASGCKFMIIGTNRNPEERPWTIRVCPGEKGRHNHPFFVYREGQVRTNRLNADIRQHIRNLTATGMQPAFIMTSIRENFPDYFPSMSQIYNIRQALRREEMDGRTPLQHCLYLATEKNYIVWTDLDSDGQLTRLLIANPISIQMIRTWPYVVLIDTTYKTNKAKWPLCEIIGMTPTNHNFLVAFCLMRDEAAVSYSWVLERLRDIYGTVRMPNVIVSDRDEGLSAAIRDVYPGK
jgi:MULE transposase-like protein